MMASVKNSDEMSSDKALRAILGLLVAQREERLVPGENGTARKTEVILAASGLTASEIVPLVGKNLEAVRKTIQRGKAN